MPGDRETSLGRRLAHYERAAFLLAGLGGFIPGVTTNYGELEFAGPESGAKLLGLFEVSDEHLASFAQPGVDGLVFRGPKGAMLMHRMSHYSSAAALRYQHATRDRDQAIAKAMGDLVARQIPAATPVRSDHADGTDLRQLFGLGRVGGREANFGRSASSAWNPCDMESHPLAASARDTLVRWQMRPE